MKQFTILSLYLRERKTQQKLTAQFCWSMYNFDIYKPELTCACLESSLG